MDTYTEIKAQALAAQQAERQLSQASGELRNKALSAMAEALLAAQAEVLAANAEDVEQGKAKGMKASFVDRLTLTPERIAAMAEGIRQVVALPDPLNAVIGGGTLPNGLQLTKVRAPLGVIGIVYEARPNVTADAIALCIKSGNAVILKGGSEALRSNKAISQVLAAAAVKAGLPAGAVQFITSTEHQAVTDLISLRGLVDVVIPRGSARLIQAVLANAKVPVIETGAGICHTYVDEAADLAMAEEICFNAKVQRPSVCNSMETLLVHSHVAPHFLPQMAERYAAAGVELRGDARCCALSPRFIPATTEDWATEYDDLILAVKLVDTLEEALEHIALYSTKHSECIVTRDLEHAQRFQQSVDAAAVYVNASTRFTDGFEFGFGAEIGISTQKLHARGPMGLPELTTVKYLITGNGQIRQ